MLVYPRLSLYYQQWH